MRSPEFSVEMWKKNPTQSALKLADQLVRVSTDRRSSRSSTFFIPTGNSDLVRGRFTKLSPPPGIQVVDNVSAWANVSTVGASRHSRSRDEILVLFTSDGSVKKCVGEPKTIDAVDKTIRGWFHEGNTVNVSQIEDLVDMTDDEVRAYTQNIHMYFGDMYRPADELDSSFFHPTASLGMRLFAQVTMLAHDVETDTIATSFANRSVSLKLQKSRDLDEFKIPTALVLEVKDPIPMIVAQGRYAEISGHEGALSRWWFTSSTPKVMYERVKPMVHPDTNEIQLDSTPRQASRFEKEYALGVLKGCVDKCN